MRPQVFLAFLWHMHQPYYKDPESGVYSMPWVRLHGVKDYYGMAAILREFPDIHQTFNLVPSLLEQIVDYIENDAVDRVLELTLKRAEELSEEDKLEILSRFFRVNKENMVFPYPRYHELLLSKGDGETHRALAKFTEQDWRDLQVWYNLVWVSPLYKGSDARYLLEKGRNFSEEDKVRLIKLHKKILREIIPLYKELSERGQVELITSPFYHPILPLIYDTDIAKESLPSTDLPQNRFNYPEDVELHISEGLRYFSRILNRKIPSLRETPGGNYVMEWSQGMPLSDLLREIGRICSSVG